MTPRPTGAQVARRTGVQDRRGYYRAAFVDLDAVVDCIPIPKTDAVVLEVGGGDGLLVDALLAQHRQVRAVMIDLNPRVGMAVRPEFRDRIELHPATNVSSYRSINQRAPDVILVSDVVHHIPSDQRSRFFADLRDLTAGRSTTMVVKDVRPGGLRARLAWLADRYVSGDKNVNFIDQDQMKTLVFGVFPAAPCEETDLYRRDAPNHCLVFALPASETHA